MSRHVDETGEWFDPTPEHNRRAYPATYEEVLVARLEGELILLRDIELGLRASELLDVHECEDDVEWRAEQARLEALYKLEAADR